MPGSPHPQGRVGRFVILREIGRGGMGIVYEALDPDIGRRVAVKVMRPAPEMDADLWEAAKTRFLQEGRSAGVLSHPNIVTVYQVGEHQGSAYLAMEFVSGLNLEQAIARYAPLPQELVWHILRSLADALDTAHAHYVIHRDVKPGNVLLGPEGVVKLGDFGLAKRQEGTSVSGTLSMVGTPYYMAPELLKNLQASSRSDQFSLAVMAYLLLSGKRPFEGESLGAVMFQLSNRQPDLLSLSNRFFSPEVDAVLSRALAKDPAHRFSCCREFVAALETATYRSVAAHTAPVAVQRADRRPLWTALLLLLVLASVLTVGWIYTKDRWQPSIERFIKELIASIWRPPPPAAPPKAEQPVIGWELSTSNPVQPLAAGGGGFVYVLSGRTRLEAMQGGKSAWFYDINESLASAVCLPGGRIALGDTTGQIEFVDAAGHLELAFDLGSRPISLETDGTHLYAVLQNGTVVAYDFTGHQLWSVVLGDGLTGSRWNQAAQSLVVLRGRQLVSVTPARRTTAWPALLPRLPVGHPDFDSKGNTYVAMPQQISAYSPKGDLLWSTPTQSELVASPAVFPDGMVAAGTAARTLEVFRDGQRIQSVPTAGLPVSLLVRHEHVLVGMQDGLVQFFDARLQNDFRIQKPGDLMPPLLFSPDESIFVSTKARNLYQIKFQ